MFMPQGLRYAVRLTVTNPSASTMGGSTSTPSVSPTDYVASLHLPGDNSFAVQILTNATDTTTFKDVSIWFGATQLDIDYDTVTYGPWDSTHGITLRFKLQATIPAAGTDSNYLLAWGNSSPTVKRLLDNIYPLYDIFTNDSTLDTSKWSVSASPNPVPTIGFDSTDGLTLTTPTGILGGVGYGFIQSAATFGPGYRMTMYGKLPQPTMPKSQIGNGIANRSGAVAPFADVQTANNAVKVVEQNGGTAQSATLSSAPDGNPHFFAVWRDANSAPVGVAHGWLDGTTVQVGTGQEFGVAVAKAVQLFVWNNVDIQQVMMSARFVKVSPYIGVDATVALASVVRAQGFPRIANVLGLDTSGGQAVTMARYALLIGNNSLFQASSGQPIIDAVRRARSGPNADMALLIYQSSVEVNYSPTTGALYPNQPTIYDDAVRGTWWLFYANSTTLNVVGGINATTTSIPISDGTVLYTDTAPLIRIDNETMLVTGGLGTTSLTVRRGVLGTSAASHSNGATVKQHVGITNAVFSSVLFNIASTLTNGTVQKPPAYLAQYILNSLAALWGVDGVFLDNVNIAPSFVKHSDFIDVNTPWSGTAATYSQLVKAWAPAEQSLQDTLRAASALLTICGNGTVYPASNGREIEHFPYLDPFLGSSIPTTAPAFLAAGIFPGYLQMALTATNPVTIVNPDTASLDDTSYPGASAINLQQMRLDLGLALQANGLYSYDGGGQDHGDPWWFEEFDRGADSSLTVTAPQSSPTHITVSTSNTSSYSTGDQLYIPNDGGSGLKYDESATIQTIMGSGSDLTLIAAIVNAHRTLQKVLRQATYPQNIGWLGQPLENPVSLLPLPTPPTGNLTTDWDFGTYNSGTHQFTSWPLAIASGSLASGTITTDTGPSGTGDQCARTTVSTVDTTQNAFGLYIAQGGLILSANTTYTLTFWAKTTSPFGFPLVVQLYTGSNFTTLVRETYVLGTTWQ